MIIVPDSIAELPAETHTSSRQIKALESGSDLIDCYNQTKIKTQVKKGIIKMIYLAEFKKELHEIFESYFEKAESVKAGSKETKLKNMDPYETVPGDEALKELTPAEKAAFNEEIQPLKDRGLLLVNNILEQIEAKRTEAPTTDAVNYVSMLKLKKNISEIEIEQAVNIYGGTYIVYEALEQIAADHDIYISANKLDEIEETMENISKQIRSMNASNIKNQTRGQISFSLMLIDNTLPDEI